MVSRTTVKQKLERTSIKLYVKTEPTATSEKLDARSHLVRINKLEHNFDPKNLDIAYHRIVCNYEMKFSEFKKSAIHKQQIVKLKKIAEACYVMDLGEIIVCQDNDILVDTVQEHVVN